MSARLSPPSAHRANSSNGRSRPLIAATACALFAALTACDAVPKATIGEYCRLDTDCESGLRCLALRCVGGRDSGQVEDLGAPDNGPAPDGGPVVDMGVVDSGTTDSGPVDAGVDQGPPDPPANARIIHAISDTLTATGVPIEGLRLCLYTPFGANPLPPNTNLNTVPDTDPAYDATLDFTAGIPHRAVSPYQENPTASIDNPITVRAYDEAVIDGATTVNCPLNNGTDSTFDSDCTDDASTGGTSCYFQVEYDDSTLVDNENYSLILQGFIDNTDTCVNPAGTPPMIDCPTGGLRLSIVQDGDADDVNATMAQVAALPRHPQRGPRRRLLLAERARLGRLPDLAFEREPQQPQRGDHGLHGRRGAHLWARLPARRGHLGDAGHSMRAEPAPRGRQLPTNIIPVFFGPENAGAQDTTPTLENGTLVTIVATGDVNFAAAPSCALVIPRSPSPSRCARPSGPTIRPCARAHRLGRPRRQLRCHAGGPSPALAK